MRLGRPRRPHEIPKNAAMALASIAALAVIFLTGHETFESRWGDAGVIAFFVVTIAAWRVLYVTTRR